MKRVLSLVGNKLGFLSAIVVAAIVGGATSAAVLAAIPDNNGRINACYNNNTKILRVTDPAANCAANATALSWDQDGWKGYGYIKHDGTLDTSRSKNVASVTLSSSDSSTYCLTTNISPRLISVTGTGNETGVVRGADAETDGAMDFLCPSANIMLSNPGVDGEIYFFFR